MGEKRLSEEFILGLFKEKKEKEIIECIFENLNEDEIVKKLVKPEKKGRQDD